MTRWCSRPNGTRATLGGRCGDREAAPFDGRTNALEIGCGEGLFTELLAPRCRSLLAVDISSRAVARARERLRGESGVVTRWAVLPAAYPDERFDLVVASDVLYYWRNSDLHSAVRRIEASLVVGGRFVAVHYAAPIGALNTGDAVHDGLTELVALASVRSEAREIGEGRPYRIDVWEKRG